MDLYIVLAIDYNVKVDGDTKWTTTELRQMQTADPVCMGQKL